MELATDQILDRGAIATVRNVGDVDLRAQVEHRKRQMAPGTVTRGTEGERSRTRVRRADEFTKRLNREFRIDDKYHGRERNLRDGCEVFACVVRDAPCHQRFIDRKVIGDNAECLTVCGRSHDIACADRSCATAAVVDDDTGSELRPERRGQQASQYVGKPARRIRNDKPDRLARGLHLSTRSAQCRKEHACSHTLQNATPISIHVGPLRLIAGRWEVASPPFSRCLTRSALRTSRSEPLRGFRCYGARPFMHNESYSI